jgi:hypothetical protein
MSQNDKRWVVTTATDRISLDEQKRGEAAFAVKNLGARSGAIFEVKPLNGADPSWFTVENPSRTLPTNASVSYVVKVGAASAPPGRYELVGRVYAADGPPEEDFAESNRVILEITGPPPAAPKKKFPWWIVIAAVAGVLVLSLVGWLVLRGGDAPVASGDAVVPNLLNKTEAQAVAALRDAQLKPGNIRHRYDESRVDAVVEQLLPYGAKLLPDTAIDFVVAVRPSAPILTAPTNGSVIRPEASASFSWTQTETWVKKWRVTVTAETCKYMRTTATVVPTCQTMAQDEQIVSSPSLEVTWKLPPVGQEYLTGWFRWEVTVIDDFDKPGTGQVGVFLMRQ